MRKTLPALLLCLSAAFGQTKQEILESRTTGEALVRAALFTGVPIALGGALIGWGGSSNVVLSESGGIMVAYGIFVGPSMGNFYLHDGGGATLGIVARAVGAGAVLAGILMDVGCSINSDGENKCNETMPKILMGGGAGMFIGGTIVNISRLWHYPVIRASVAPTWNPADQAYGARLAFSY